MSDTEKDDSWKNYTTKQMLLNLLKVSIVRVIIIYIVFVPITSLVEGDLSFTYRDIELLAILFPISLLYAVFSFLIFVVGKFIYQKTGIDILSTNEYRYQYKYKDDEDSMQRRERKKREKLEQQLKEKRDDGRWDNNRFQEEIKLWR